MTENRAPVYYIHYSDIIMEDRLRNKPGDIKKFAGRLAEEGQINPITYENRDGQKHLITGGRRLAACMMLDGMGQSIGFALPPDNPRRLEPGVLMAQDFGELDQITALRIELSENVNRKEFTKAEEALGYAKLKKLMEEESGRSITTTELADHLNLSIGQIGMGLKVADAVNRKGRTDLLDSPSVKAAYQKLKTSEKIAEMKKRVENRKVVHEAWESKLVVGNGLHWLKTLKDKSVDFFNFDPPWGIGVDEYDRQHKYEEWSDAPDIWPRFTAPAVFELYRVLNDDTWGVMWFGYQFYELASKTLKEAGFRVSPVPAIWYKTNKDGATSNPDLDLLNVYEPYLIVRKGDPRMFKRVQKNVQEFPMTSSSRRIHFAQKPVDLMADILERYSFGSMHVIDPSFGSGSVFAAARRLGREFSGCELSQDNRDQAVDFIKEG